jgi:thioredoxin-dependent peroxiredoxin
MIQEGDQFPDFDLQDQDGNSVSPTDLKGSRAVVYFYPKDDTSGCTAQACEFRDLMPRFEGNAKIIGVSPDDATSHRKFIDKYNLNFTLLADTDHQLAEAVGVWVEKSMYGRSYMGVERTTFLLDENGKVIKVFRKVKPKGHAEEVSAALS